MKTSIVSLVSALILCVMTLQVASQNAAAALIVNVASYGALADDDNDDTVAIQTAINAANSGDRVFIPNGIYKIYSWGRNTINGMADWVCNYKAMQLG
jgi:polygalacturonase